MGLMTADVAGRATGRHAICVVCPYAICAGGSGEAALRGKQYT